MDVEGFRVVTHNLRANQSVKILMRDSYVISMEGRRGCR
jgi:hypothetical protein